MSNNNSQKKESMTSRKHYEILLIEDDEIDAKEICQGMNNVEWDHNIHRATNLADGLSLIRELNFDVALVDLSLPDADNLESLEQLLEIYVEFPIIVCTALGSTEMALNAIRAGADDFLVKDPKLYAALPRIIRYSVERQQMHVQRRKLAGERERAELLFSKALAVVDDAVAVTDGNGLAIVANGAMLRSIGLPLARVTNQPLVQLLERDIDSNSLEELWSEAMATKQMVTAMIKGARAGHPAKRAVRSVVVEMMGGQHCFLTSFSVDPAATDAVTVMPAANQDDGEIVGDVIPAANQDDGEIVGDVIAGRIQLVGLGDIRAKLGEDWERLADLAYQKAREIIPRYLTEGDTYRETPSHNFLLIYKNADEEKAWHDVRAMSREIESAIMAAAKSIGGAMSWSDEDLDKVAAVQGEVVATNISPQNAYSIDSLSMAITEKLKKAAEKLEHTARFALEEIQVSGLKRFQTVRTNAGKRAPFVVFALDDRSRMTLTRLLSTIDESSDIRYRINMILLGKAIDLLIETTEFEVPVLCVDIAYGMLQSPDAQLRFFKTCENLPKPIRQRLAFCIDNITAAASRDRLLDAIGRLKPYSRLQMIEINPQSKELNTLAGIGTSVIRFNYDRFWRAVAKSADGGKSLVARAQTGGARILVVDIPDSAGAKLVGAAGVDLYAFEHENN